MAINASVCVTVEAENEEDAKRAAEAVAARAVDAGEGVNLSKTGGFVLDDDARLYFFPDGKVKISVEDVADDDDDEIEDDDEDGDEPFECDDCGSENMEYARRCANGTVYRCKDCGEESLL